MRAVANTLLQDLGSQQARFDIKALRPPTFEQLQKELADAKKAGRPYHIVHFDGHGVYADLSKSQLAEWAQLLSSVMLGGSKSGKHGYLIFEHAGETKMRPVDGQTLGQVLHDNGVPVLVLNACQSAMHDAVEAPKSVEGVHDEVRAIGSLSQAVIDQGIPAVLGMRYSVYVVTAAQYIGQLYAALAGGGTFGQAATLGRKHLHLNPDRWLGLEPRPLQDWFVPVAYEAGPVELLPVGRAAEISADSELDPIQQSPGLLRYVPDKGFVGRDETLLALDRAFDKHRVVLLHAYAGQGKSSTAVEFARWYSMTGGLGDNPLVLLASFEAHTDLDDLLNQIGQPFAPVLEQRGIHWGALNDPEARRQLALQLLRLVPVLWIWDNVEPVAGFPEGTESQWTVAEQNDLRDFLKQIKLDTASRAKILLTSRRDETKWQGDIPYRIPMPRMSKADAASLALKLGEERELSRSDMADWQPLLDYCAGNPLTLRVLVGQAVREDKRGRRQIADFVEAIRTGEARIQDADEEQGRDKSLGASLDYGFRNAFQRDEVPIIALLHLFQSTVDVDALFEMGRMDDYALPELKAESQQHLTNVLKRATEIGLLTHLGSTWFTIHPALPWFLRQLFVQHYDGQDGHSTAEAALRSWVTTIGWLASFYCEEFRRGNEPVFEFLQLEENNLLYALKLARRNQWWQPVISCMDGIDALYQRQGRMAEWGRLVNEIVPDFCTADDEPISGRERHYANVMMFRVNLAKGSEFDFGKAASLQEKAVEFNRQQAAAARELPKDKALNPTERDGLHRLAVSLITLGQIRSATEDSDCERHLKDAIEISRRIDDKPTEEVAEFNLGHAYLQVNGILDLDKGEAAYRRSLDLLDPNDVLGRSKTIAQIGMVHHRRFRDARKRREPVQTLLKHLEGAETFALEALQCCPVYALRELGNHHNSLGTVYRDANNAPAAREQFERAAQCFEKVGDHLRSGTVRFNMADLFFIAARNQDGPSEGQQRCANLQIARAYAEAALRDYQRFEGRAAEREAIVRKLIGNIDQLLAVLPG